MENPRKRCPICGYEQNSSVLCCARCGFDASSDAETWPMLCRPMGSQRSQRGLRDAWQERQKRETMQEHDAGKASPDAYENGKPRTGKVQNGYGIYPYKNGEVYAGEWKDGKRDGSGVMTYADGNRYMGEWKEDLFDGWGVYTGSDGKAYTGKWKKGECNGQGTLHYADGDCYAGEWKDGKRSGKGIYLWADGRRYEGTWKEGECVGHGTLTEVNGTVQHGKMIGDEFVPDAKPEAASWFEGMFGGRK